MGKIGIQMNQKRKLGVQVFLDTLRKNGKGKSKDDDPEYFIPARRFEGAKPGYIFKASGRKLGYFKDEYYVPPEENEGSEPEENDNEILDDEPEDAYSKLLETLESGGQDSQTSKVLEEVRKQQLGIEDDLEFTQQNEEVGLEAEIDVSSDNNSGDDDDSEEEEEYEEGRIDDEVAKDDPFTKRFQNGEVIPKHILACIDSKDQGKPPQKKKLETLAKGTEQVLTFGIEHHSKNEKDVFESTLKAPKTLPSVNELCIKLHVKTRLAKRWVDSSKKGFTPLQKRLATEIFNYRDLFLTCRSLLNASELRDLCALHSLNHVMKSRDLVQKHNMRLKTQAIRRKQKRQERAVKKELGEEMNSSDEEDKGVENNEEDDLKDQGFARPKVLYLVPTRVAALRVVSRLIDLLPEGAQVMNKSRFLDEYGGLHGATFNEEDYLDGRALPGGALREKRAPNAPLPKRPVDWYPDNDGDTGDCFRLGLSMQGRKNFKIYSDFFSSDIIVASPLGLRLATGESMVGGDEDIEDEEGSKKKLNSDFLSSLEILVVDQMDVLRMQNWQHMVDLAGLFNNSPKSLRETMDFSRIRDYFLEDGKSARFRQNLLFDQYPNAQARSLAFHGNNTVPGLLSNFSGCLKVAVKTYSGSAGECLLARTHKFRRVDLEDKYSARHFAGKHKKSKNDSSDDEDDVVDDDERFAYFKENIFTDLRGPFAPAHTLIFVPSYFDYVKVRNLFAETCRKRTTETFEGLLASRKKNKSKNQSKNKKKKLSQEDDGEPSLFCSVCEYTEPKDVTRARGEFFHGRTKNLIITERFMYYFRYKLRGIHRVIFYAPPQHPQFYSELVDLIENKEGNVVTLYEPKDALELARICGKKNAKAMTKKNSRLAYEIAF